MNLVNQRKTNSVAPLKVARHIPKRSCVACRSTRPKRELIRLVCGKDGRVEIDLSGKKMGRGAYLCSSSDCWGKSLKKSRMEHTLRQDITPESWVKLQEFGRMLAHDDPASWAWPRSCPSPSASSAATPPSAWVSPCRWEGPTTGPGAATEAACTSGCRSTRRSARPPRGWTPPAAPSRTRSSR